MLLSHCCKDLIMIKETSEGAYYICSICKLPTDPISVIIFQDLLDELKD